MTKIHPQNALALLAGCMIPNDADLVASTTGKQINLITSRREYHTRLVGQKGQNINALISLAGWMGHSLKLAEYDTRVEGQGKPDELATQPANTSELIKAYLEAVLSLVMETAGVPARVEVSTDGDEPIVFVAIEHAWTSNPPTPEVTAALAKVVRAIAIRHGWQDIEFSCVCG